MNDFMVRLNDERDELEKKVEKLSDFLNNNPVSNSLSTEQAGLLHIQLKAMQTYLLILEVRLSTL